MKKQLNIRPEVLPLNEKLISYRREIHMHPELAFQEIQTALFIKTQLEKLGIEVISEVGKTGVVGLIKGKNPGKCILLRADMDALPLEENTGLSFESKNKGIFHACGHDGHVAMLLIAAEILKSFEDKIKGSVKLVFQPAEERGPGALEMIVDNKYPVLKNPDVDKCFGIHLMSPVKLGEMWITEGSVSCTEGIFFIEIITLGGHNSQPHKAQDAIYIGNFIAKEIYGIKSQNVDPCQEITLAITMMNGGNAINIYANKCEIVGNFRMFLEEDKIVVEKRITEICDCAKVLFGVQVNLKFVTPNYPSIINTKVETIEAIDSASKIIGKSNIFSKRTLIGEDFSFFLKEKPGCFVILGASHEGKNLNHHSPKFDFDEDALLIGVSFWIQLIEDLLITN